MPSDTYTVREAAERCHTSVWTIYRRIEEGQIEAFRAGGGRRLLIRADSLQAFIDHHRIPAEQQAEQQQRPDRPIRVLLVEDDAVLRSTTKMMLEAGRLHKVTCASSGFAAGVALGKEVPDVILLDIVLGDLDGREVIRVVRDDPKMREVRIIGISGRLSEDDWRELVELGFDDYLSKPFEINDLERAIEQVLAAPPRHPLSSQPRR